MNGIRYDAIPCDTIHYSPYTIGLGSVAELFRVPFFSEGMYGQVDAKVTDELMRNEQHNTDVLWLYSTGRGMCKTAVTGFVNYVTGVACID